MIWTNEKTFFGREIACARIKEKDTVKKQDIEKRKVSIR